MRPFRNPRKQNVRPIIPPQPKPGWVYTAPTFAAEKRETLHLADEGHQLKIRRCMYKRLVVDFAFIQVYYLDGVPHHVAKIDCCGGTVHQHQYVRPSGKDILDHDPLIVIPQRNPYEVVDEWYDRSLHMMVYGWEDNFRRWNDGADE